MIRQNSSITRKTTVMVVDDHRLFCEGIEAILSKAHDMEIVGSAANGDDAVKRHAALQPDVILMDAMLRGMNSMEATRCIKEQQKSVRVILISSEVNNELISSGIESGIDGYVSKRVSQATLLNAIRTVIKGGKYFNDEITNLVFNQYYDHRRNISKFEKYRSENELTPREMEVLSITVSGKSNKEVANHLGITVKTVETHKTNIMNKLGLRNTAELVRYAIKHRIVSLD